MTRLWEKGLPLDERVLRYTAGEDHLLDARLVAYDVRGSIAHAEMLAIRAACAALGQERLTGCDIWVSLEPCPACAGAIAAARLSRLYYAASDPKSGGVAQGPCVFDHPQSHWRPEIYSGMMENEAAALLRAFFAAKRGG